MQVGLFYAPEKFHYEKPWHKALLDKVTSSWKPTDSVFLTPPPPPPQWWLLSSGTLNILYLTLKIVYFIYRVFAALVIFFTVKSDSRACQANIGGIYVLGCIYVTLESDIEGEKLEPIILPPVKKFGLYVVLYDCMNGWVCVHNVSSKTNPLGKHCHIPRVIILTSYDPHLKIPLNDMC